MHVSGQAQPSFYLAGITHEFQQEPVLPTNPPPKPKLPSKPKLPKAIHAGITTNYHQTSTSSR